jgi:hypothetical protein
MGCVKLWMCCGCVVEARIIENWIWNGCKGGLRNVRVRRVDEGASE